MKHSQGHREHQRRRHEGGGGHQGKRFAPAPDREDRPARPQAESRYIEGPSRQQGPDAGREITPGHAAEQPRQCKLAGPRRSEERRRLRRSSHDGALLNAELARRKKRHQPCAPHDQCRTGRDRSQGQQHGIAGRDELPDHRRSSQVEDRGHQREGDNHPDGALRRPGSTRVGCSVHFRFRPIRQRPRPRPSRCRSTASSRSRRLTAIRSATTPTTHTWTPTVIRMTARMSDWRCPAGDSPVR